MMIPSPLSKAPKKELALARGLCFDLDDTLSTGGRIEPSAWRALWAGYEAGLAMVPVTGRPAGWCDLICRFWPVAGVVGENGAFYFSHDSSRRKVIRRFARGPVQREKDKRALAKVAQAVLTSVPRARVAADQPFRITDLAVDFAEDVGPLSSREVDRIVSVMQAHGLMAKVSSIHVNGWFGQHDKRSMLFRFARERLGLSKSEAIAQLVYVGDSPNDEPLFAVFPLSVGVANVKRYLPEMESPPAYVTRRKEGAGFAELVRLILRARQDLDRGR